MYTNACKHSASSDWQTNKYCAQSCYEHGAGYDGDVCTLTPATPKIEFEGSGGISIKNAHRIIIKGIEIEGPANRITGREASLNRLRQTSKTVTGASSGVCSKDDCHSCHDQTTCLANNGLTAYCKWSSSVSKCEAKPMPYYQGSGIAVWAGTEDSTYITVEDCVVHHCPGSGIRANKVDNSIFRNNIVYDNVWWTVSASSGVVFAELRGTGNLSLTGNIIFGNRNFMPFFYEDLSNLEGAHAAADGYSQWNQSYIIDGSGANSLALNLTLALNLSPSSSPSPSPNSYGTGIDPWKNIQKSPNPNPNPDPDPDPNPNSNLNLLDGSGAYITRNQNFEGFFNLSDNTCFDNGINGVVVHKTSHASVSTLVERNIMFSNGRTTKLTTLRTSSLRAIRYTIKMASLMTCLTRASATLRLILLPPITSIVWAAFPLCTQTACSRVVNQEIHPAVRLIKTLLVLNIQPPQHPRRFSTFSSLGTKESPCNLG